jgi:AraC-like DNA-binding protein
MLERIYFYTTLLSGVIGLTLALLLAGLKISPGEGLQKYSRARWCLVGAFAVFGVMNLMEASLDGTTVEDTGDFSGCLAIVIGSLLAMLFTMTVLSFVRPQVVSRKRILAQLAVIVPPCILLIIMRIYAPEPVFRVFFRVMLALYLLLMALYTRLFVRSYRTFKEQMLAFYEEEDLVGQLQWINWTFWLALALGIAALMFLVESPEAGSILNIIFSACFLFMYVFFVNYRPYALMVDRAVEKESVEEIPEEVTGDDDSLRPAVESWVARKGYLDNTKSVEDIATDMGVQYAGLKEYIRRTTGEDFRSWRIRLRVLEAERILSKHPEIPVSRVATMAGFNDRAYFYRCFLKVTGHSVREGQK